MQDLINIRRNGLFSSDEIRLKHTSGTGRECESALCGFAGKTSGTNMVSYDMMLVFASEFGERRMPVFTALGWSLLRHFFRAPFKSLFSAWCIPFSGSLSPLFVISVLRVFPFALFKWCQSPSPSCSFPCLINVKDVDLHKQGRAKG
jgi:hypothetical protein